MNGRMPHSGTKYRYASRVFYDRRVRGGSGGRLRSGTSV